MDEIEERMATLRSGLRLPYAETGRSGGSIPMVTEDSPQIDVVCDRRAGQALSLPRRR